jgi:hypothetical protein
MSVSSVSDDGLLEEERPLQRKGGGNRKQEPQQDASDITTYNTVEYALYLCRGHGSTREFKIECKADNNEHDALLILLDESGTC